MSRRKWFQMLVITVVTACLLVFSGMASAQGNSDNAFERVKEVQERHTAKLMAQKGVVGTAAGLTEDDRPAVLVLLEQTGVAQIPGELDGVPVRALVTGKIEALGSSKALPSKGKASQKIDPTDWFERPVPIGVSTGNATSYSAGTIGCRVSHGGSVYALSNNHVYALENTASIGDKVVQPGLYDTGGKYDPQNDIGTLTAFVPIEFSTSANNTVDAAIAASTTDLLGNSTPADGYGMPTSSTTTATVGMAVQKYGRTTSLTRGTVTAINAIINIGYSSGTARFTGQIIVQSRAPFIKAGDSGSLLVTDPGKSPVGLLFAGDSSGKFAIANNIDAVLSALGVNIDGE
ncbi:MAG: S1 family peptidase [Planctomycetes bacterium]|nr:S1 family peptidase [Planctomycetota bacterium]